MVSLGTSPFLSGVPISTTPTRTTFRTFLAIGMQPGILTIGNSHTLLSDGAQLWQSTIRQGGFSQVTLPDTRTGLSVALGYSAQFLGVVMIGSRRGTVADPPKFSGTLYYPIVDIDQTGNITWGSPRTSPTEVGMTTMVHLDWPGRGSGSADRIIGITNDSFVQTASGSAVQLTDNVLVQVRSIAQGANLANVNGPWWQTSDGEITQGTPTLTEAIRDWGFRGDWVFDIEHNGASRGAFPNQRLFQFWFAGPMPRAAASTDRDYDIIIGRADPHSNPEAPTVETSSWTGGLTPVAGIYNGSDFLVARFLTDETPNVVSMRAYRTPSNFVSFPATPDYPNAITDPEDIAAMRMFLAGNQIGILIMEKEVTNRKPVLYEIRWILSPDNLSGNWEPNWTRLEETEQWPAAAENTGMLNIDRFSGWGDTTAQMMDSSGNVYVHTRALESRPIPSWAATNALTANVASPLVLDWSVAEGNRGGQVAYRLRREYTILAGPTAGTVSSQYWNATLNSGAGGWQDASYFNNGAIGQAVLPVGWHGATPLHGRYPDVSFFLDVQDIRRTGAGQSLAIDPWVVQPFATLSDLTFTGVTPPPGGTILARLNVEVTFPSDAPFDPMLLQDGSVFAANYEIRVTPLGNQDAPLATSGVQLVTFPSGAATPYTATFTPRFLANGNFSIWARWFQYGVPNNVSRWIRRDFIIDLTLPAPPTLTFRSINPDGTRSNLTTGFGDGTVGVRVIMTGTGGAGQAIASARLWRREQSRSDHRTADATPILIGTVDNYTTNSFIEDYRVASGVEYQYQVQAIGVEGSETRGAWTPS